MGDTDILDVLTEIELLELGSLVRAGMGRFMSGSSPDSLPVRGRVLGDQESGVDLREDVSALSSSTDAAARSRCASATLSFLDIISFSLALAVALTIAFVVPLDIAIPPILESSFIPTSLLSLSTLSFNSFSFTMLSFTSFSFSFSLTGVVFKTFLGPIEREGGVAGVGSGSNGGLSGGKCRPEEGVEGEDCGLRFRPRNKVNLIKY